MSSKLHIYNSLTREKELFEPLNAPNVGMYVCGPTVYNDVHLGNCRTFIFFDVMYRYLTYLGYKVRYVRNITDVGHLENDADEGDDKIAKRAKLENLEPMELVQKYTNNFHEVEAQFNNKKPSIEPSATGHILEQIQMVEKLIENGYAYESNGSVYFDVVKFNEDHDYGKLSGRILEDLQSNSRDNLEGASDKRSPFDFAVWKNASPQHIMRWDSPWGAGFPGWHLECSVMSQKYLGETFDIHGGGMDLKFPHHECEIAQSVGTYGSSPVRYWVHTNMLTVNGTKMSKSLGNSFWPAELFTGDHELLDKGYSPMAVRFFTMQSHYSSTLDFSNEALSAAEKGYHRLMNALKILKGLEYQTNGVSINEAEDAEVIKLCHQCEEKMNDDFNTAETIATLFDLSKKINSFNEKIIPLSSISESTFDLLKKTFITFIEEVLGLQAEDKQDDSVTDGLIQFILDMRQNARANKDWDTSDKIRDILTELKIQVKDGKEGSSWTINS